MRRLIGAAALAAAAGLPAPACAEMTVNGFLGKIAGLKAKGPFALFSSDIGLLKRESAATIAAITADKKARAAAGKPPLFCASDTTRMSAGEMIAGLQAIPPAQRGISLQDGFMRVIARKYPCP